MRREKKQRTKNNIQQTEKSSLNVVDGNRVTVAALTAAKQQKKNTLKTEQREKNCVKMNKTRSEFIAALVGTQRACLIQQSTLKRFSFGCYARTSISKQSLFISSFSLFFLFYVSVLAS